MMLPVLILVPLIFGVGAYVAARVSVAAARWIALLSLAGNLGLSIYIWIAYFGPISLAGVTGPWVLEWDAPWIAPLGVHFHVGMDGLSLLLVVLTNLLGVLSVAASWTEIEERPGFFHLNLLWVVAGIVGVFLSLDLFLFYVFWELMLVPMYFLIAIWGHENRVYAAVKFFIFTQFSGLFMLLAIVGLYVLYGSQTGGTFEYANYIGAPIPRGIAMVLMLGFFVAFAVKLPVVPLHSWLPDAHTEAPTAGSVILAGLLLKTGAYGLIRFVVPLFPWAVADFRPAAMTLALIGILYGALAAYGQTDLKRLIAYTSISHMGLVLLGIFAWNSLALQGAVMLVLCHGLATGGLFIFAGALQERTKTRDIRVMGGLWSTVPRMSGATMVLALASLDLPGLGNFIGGFLVLLGTFRAYPVYAAGASLGLIVSTIYSLRIIQAVFHGEKTVDWKIADLHPREVAIMAVIIGALIWLGLYPQPALDTVQPSLNVMQQTPARGPAQTPVDATPGAP
ncbi:MAG: NADH-quinone oxidoreductase subunit M [Candidatus Hydrogenedentes bacterium]|nr:NADH-quinone oxidoreductase subunit M [Candidatus Hydrogenedentota bacterium]